MTTDTELTPWHITRTESFLDSSGKRHDSYEQAARANLLRIIGSTGNGTTEIAESIVNAIMLGRADIYRVLDDLDDQDNVK